MADAVGSATNVIKGFVPKIGIFGSSAIGYIAWVIIIVLIAIVFGIGIFFFIRSKKFDKKIIIFEDINGRFEPTKNDRATEVKLSTGGDTIFYLLKHKKYIPTPSLQTGRKIYWYFIRQDGEWINFGLEDLNESSRSIGAKFLDKEMRYARTQIQRGLKERYDKPGFWQQYGMIIFNITYMVLLGVMIWLLFDKWLDLASVTNKGVETAGIVMEKVDSILGGLDNICSGGSGIK